jgi:hypothetical protein
MGSNDSSSIIISFSIAILLLLVLLLLISYNSKCNMDNVERFEADYPNQANFNDETIADYIKEDLHQPLRSGANYDTPFLDVINGTAPQGTVMASNPERQYANAINNGNVESFKSKDGTDDTCDPYDTNCFSRDRLTSKDLLPSDSGNSKWGEMNPATGSLITDQSFLTAGYHIGINTIGQSLRNANLQLRSEPPNPQIPVSPWGISTIEPDIRQVGFEIGSCPSST